MYTLQARFLGKDISLSWTNIDDLKKYSRVQLGRYYFPEAMTDSEFFAKFKDKVFYNWRRIAFNLDLSNIGTVVDVGSGIAVPDLMFSRFNENAKFYLVDKNEFGRASGNYYEEEHSGYNSWDVVRDCISNSNIDSNRFNFLSPDDAWPQEVDLVLSTYSWCWHYPKDTYWKKVQDSLKIGGKLAVDILFRPDRDVVKEISDEFDSDPIVLPTKMPNSIFKDQLTVNSRGYCGGFYIWTKNK